MIRAYPIAPGFWRVCGPGAYGFDAAGQAPYPRGWPMRIDCVCAECIEQGARVAPRGRR